MAKGKQPVGGKGHMLEQENMGHEKGEMVKKPKSGSGTKKGGKGGGCK